MSNFGKNVKQLRVDRGLSQAELADLLGISKSAISMYENGKREPDFERLDAVSSYFCISFHALLGPNENLGDAEMLSQGDESKQLSWAWTHIFGHPDHTLDQEQEVKSFARFVYERDKNK